MTLLKSIQLVVICGLLAPLLNGCAAVAIGGAAATGVAMLHDRRSSGALIDDETIEIKALLKLREHSSLLEQTHINITSYNGIVLLSGEVPSEVIRQKIATIILAIPRVRHIYNELLLTVPSSFSTRSHDSWVTSKSKMVLFKVGGFPGFDPSRMKIITESGNIFLMGLVSHQEADISVELVRRIQGVQKVIKLFEYID